MAADDEELPQVGTRPYSLDLAHQYLDNARHIGEQGEPSMIEGRELQHAHAEMAQASALVAIAEVLDKMERANRVTARRMTTLVQAMSQLAKEITKIRYIVR